MRKASCVLVGLLLFGTFLVAQVPTGSISGTVTDASGAVIPNAKIVMTNKETGVSQTVASAANGSYSVVALPAGTYGVRVEAAGFSSRERGATVAVGNTTRVDFQMKVGATTDTVTVEAASAQMNFDTNVVQGVVQQETIEDIPLNGRNYQQLAKLEPGVTIATGTVAQFNVLFTVSVLGAGNRTSTTVDGGNVSDSIDVGGGISSMNFSTESVQEFQLQSVNFDISTGITAGGAINVVTRSGSNNWHGSGYFYFRDHNMAAYPYLNRLPASLPGGASPFFARRNPGFTFGGPLKKDKIFFFTSYEYTNQVQAVSVQSTDPAFVNLAGTYGSPYHQDLFSLRVDDHISDKHNLFIRYSHDGNAGFGQSLEFGDPSNWAHNTNWADQSIIGLTSTLTPSIVNDAHFQFNYWNNHNSQSVASDCSAPCVAGSLPNIFTFVGSNFPATGPNFNAPQGRNSRRYEVTDQLNWQLHNHRIKFGGDSNRIISAGLWGFCTPLCTGAFSPTYTRAALVGALGLPTFNFLYPTLPTTLKTDADVLNLPVLNIGSSIFSGVGVGAVSTPAPYDFAQHKGQSQYRLFVQDQWKIRPNLTVNYGFAWNAQVGQFNSDLPKPAYLAPIVGSDLSPTGNNTKEFQPAFGFAWSPGKSAKTVIRGGAGIYWDSSPGYYYLREAPVIGPLLDGRYTLAASAFTNIYPGILDFSLGGAPLAVGASLPLSHLTNMTVGQFINIVNLQTPALTAKLGNPPASGSISGLTTGIQQFKQGVEIFPSHFPFARSYQTSLGVQHDFGHGMVLTADWARRQGENVALGEQDLNLYNRYLGSATPVPVIPLCTGAQAANPSAECSTGSITFWQDAGRAIYEGLLVKFVKTSSKYNVIASYALQRATTEGVWDEAHYASGYGQYLNHQTLNIAATVKLPYGFMLALNSAYISKSPVTANVNGLILPGTVAAGSTEPLPGLAVGSLNAGNGPSQLAAAVASYNSSVVGTKNAAGQAITGTLALPSNYDLGTSVITQDIRFTKTFTFKERYKIAPFVELFNVLNVSNVVVGSYTLDSAASVAAGTAAFGQPTQRVGQTFGSGGPRAVQVGARISF